MFTDRLLDDAISIYIHWPFCLSKCPYCDFNSHVTSMLDQEEWKKAYLYQISYFKPIIEGKKIRSIFFGGGTPSLMNSKLVYSIINAISYYAQLDNNTEITLEANPTSVEAEKFQSFASAGVNRVSIGIQSLYEKGLKFLGRTHDISSIKNSIQLAKKFFLRFSFDLIYCYPGQTLLSWKEELAQAIEMAEGHLSLYQLTIEKGTKFFSLWKKNQLVMPSNEVAADYYQYTKQYLSRYNYCQYEISNYSFLGLESKHNLNYWNYGSYLGIGPGAHSRLACVDFDKIEVKSMSMYYQPQKWLNQALNQSSAVQNMSNLSKSEILCEIIMMGLRLSNGITDQRLYQLINKRFYDVLNFTSLNKFVKLGYIEKNNEYLNLTKKGMLFHNHIVSSII